MLSNRVELTPGTVIEDLGDDLIVMVPGSPEVVTLSGHPAHVVRMVQKGQSVSSDDAVSDLVRLGILRTGELSRRGLIKAGAIGAGAGITVLAMPGVAAASSQMFTIFFESGGARFFIPLAQQANFSSGAQISSGSVVIERAGNPGTDAIGGVTYWVFNSFVGSIPGGSSWQPGPWTITDGGVTLATGITAVQLPPSGP